MASNNVDELHNLQLIEELCRNLRRQQEQERQQEQQRQQSPPTVTSSGIHKYH